MVDADMLWRRLAAGEEIRQLGLDRIGERWDLRSLTTPSLPWSRRDPMPTLRKVTFRALDFSGTRLSHFRFFNCHFIDCRFEGAHLDDWRFWESVIEDCSFEGAKIQGGMGGDRRHPNTWRRVDFSDADMRESYHHLESYYNCTFRDTRLKRVSFDGSRHHNSRFLGQMEEVEFRAASRSEKGTRDPNLMEGVDLRAATVRYCTFHKIDLSSSLLPATPEHLRFHDRGFFAARVLQVMESTHNENVWLRTMMQAHLRDAVDGGGGPGFQHRADLGETEEEIEAAVALLRSLGAS